MAIDPTTALPPTFHAPVNGGLARAALVPYWLGSSPAMVVRLELDPDQGVADTIQQLPVAFDDPQELMRFGSACCALALRWENDPRLGTARG